MIFFCINEALIISLVFAALDHSCLEIMYRLIIYIFFRNCIRFALRMKKNSLGIVVIMMMVIMIIKMTVMTVLKKILFM